jgi:hypothetical protein
MRHVTWRQENNDIAIDVIAFQVAIQCGPVNFYVLNHNWFRTGHNRGHFSFKLSERRSRHHHQQRGR